MGTKENVARIQRVPGTLLLVPMGLLTKPDHRGPPRSPAPQQATARASEPPTASTASADSPAVLRGDLFSLLRACGRGHERGAEVAVWAFATSGMPRRLAEGESNLSGMQEGSERKG